MLGKNKWGPGKTCPPWKFASLENVTMKGWQSNSPCGVGVLAWMLTPAGDLTRTCVSPGDPGLPLVTGEDTLTTDGEALPWVWTAEGEARSLGRFTSDGLDLAVWVNKSREQNHLIHFYTCSRVLCMKFHIQWVIFIFDISSLSASEQRMHKTSLRQIVIKLCIHHHGGILIQLRLVNLIL